MFTKPSSVKRNQEIQEAMCQIKIILKSQKKIFSPPNFKESTQNNKLRTTIQMPIRKQFLREIDWSNAVLSVRMVSVTVLY